MAQIVGTFGPDFLAGTQAADEMYALSGNDLAEGSDGSFFSGNGTFADPVRDLVSLRC